MSSYINKKFHNLLAVNNNRLTNFLQRLEGLKTKLTNNKNQKRGFYYVKEKHDYLKKVEAYRYNSHLL